MWVDAPIEDRAKQVINGLLAVRAADENGEGWERAVGSILQRRRNHIWESRREEAGSQIWVVCHVCGCCCRCGIWNGVW
ncbi:hypothetical protein LINPERPRIM_LOCUS17313 [Linum perenne]